MRAAAIAAAVVAAFVGVMYLRFANDSVPGPPPGSAVGGPQCVVFRDVTNGGDDKPAASPCGPAYASGQVQPPRIVESIPPPGPVVPAVLSDMKTVPLVPGQMIDLAPEIALILETGCWQCDAGVGNLVRVRTRTDGLVVRDSLLDTAALGLPPRQFTDTNGIVSEFLPFITGYALTPDASDIIATICVRGSCAPEGFDSWSADSQTALMRSRDGGVTWNEIGRINVGASVFALLPDGRALLTTYDSRESTKVRAHPGLEEVQFTAGLQYWPRSVTVLRDGQLVLRDVHGIPARSDGHPLISIPSDGSAWVSDLVIDPDSLEGLALISGYGGNTNYLVPFDGTGQLGRGAFALGGDSIVWKGNPDQLGIQLSSEGLILANAPWPSTEPPIPGQGPASDYRPVALDLRTGTMHLLRQFSGPEYRSGRNHMVAVQRGPFARVVNTDNTCLNVRAEPLPSAGILDCAAEGVLLRQLGDETDFAGSTWLQVSTPAGSVGWANAAYLER
jgi:hypothetical protein